MRAHAILDLSGVRFVERPDLTPEEQAAIDAALAQATERAAKAAQIRADVATALADVKSGAVDFGNMGKNRTIRVLLRGLRFLLTDEVDE